MVADAVSIPVIASSGAGKAEHFSEVFHKTDAAAALAAGMFHRKEVRGGWPVGGWVGGGLQGGGVFVWPFFFIVLGGGGVRKKIWSFFGDLLEIFWRSFGDLLEFFRSFFGDFLEIFFLA